jgi:hypothetical protein
MIENSMGRSPMTARILVRRRDLAAAQAVITSEDPDPSE